MDAYRCDRCKNYKDGSPAGNVVLNVRHPKAILKVTLVEKGHLCSPCAQDIRKVIEVVEVDDGSVGVAMEEQ